MNSFAGITNWVVGMIMVDRANKSSRKALKEKMIYVLKNGTSVLIYPEGTWNKSPNQIISGLFHGVYEVARESGAPIVPIANQRESKTVYSVVGDSFDIADLSCECAIELIKERLSTLRYELMEKYGHCQRKDFPIGKDLDEYWQDHIDALMAEVPYYDYELEKHTKYREKNVTLPEDAYDFFKRIRPSSANAFLYRNNKRWWDQ